MTTLVLLARAARTWLVAAGRSLASRRFGCWVRHLGVSKHTGSLLRMPLLADGFQVFRRPVEILRLRPRDPGQAREEQHEAFPGRYERRWRVDGEKPGDVLGQVVGVLGLLGDVHAAERDVQLCAVLRPIEDQGGELLDDRLDLRDRRCRGPTFRGSTVLARERLADLRRSAPLAQSDA